LSRREITEMWLEYDAPHRAVKGLDCYHRQPDPNRAQQIHASMNLRAT
jgi:hypothetical protein